MLKPSGRSALQSYLLLTLIVLLAICAFMPVPLFAEDDDECETDDDEECPGNGNNNKRFDRIATYITCQNTSCDTGLVGRASPEILAVTTNGKTLIYTDAAMRVFGFININDPANPVGGGVVATAGGRPTSVVVKDNFALVTVNTSASFVSPSGYLAVYNLTTCIPNPGTCTPVRTIDLGGQPDSIALSPNGRWAAIAIENERDEDVTVDGVEGGLPQAPGGFLVVVDTNGNVSGWSKRNVSLNGLASYGPNDPEPEFVTINSDNIAAVTLQENNHVVLVNLPNARVVDDFSAGTVSLTQVDTVEDDVIRPIGTITNSKREPDAIAWVTNTRLVTANEGDLGGGGRGFTIFNSSTGAVVADSGNEFEKISMRHGHYPESRSENKGSEPEGILIGRYGNTPFMFVGSERGNFVAVYRMNGVTRTFLQVLPTGIEPEGLLAIPSRDLFVVASAGDEGARSQIAIYKLKAGAVNYPSIVSVDKAGQVIPWGALSALAASRTSANLAYTVADRAYDETKIYSVRVDRSPAEIVDVITLNKNGAPVRYDLEGLAHRTGGGFWGAHEGGNNCVVATKAGCNLLVEIAADGTVMQEIMLPPGVSAKQVNTGFEGVAVTGTGTSERVYVAFEREWKTEPAGFARIGVYNAFSEDPWTFFYYPLDAVQSPAGGTVHLGEIASLGNNRFAVVERDNQAGPDARIKKIYTFSIAGLTPIPEGGGPIPVLIKTLSVDLLPLLKAPKGWVLEKPTGFTVAIDGKSYVVTDNDGVDESLGETQFLKLGTAVR